MEPIQEMTSALPYPNNSPRRSIRRASHIQHKAGEEGDPIPGMADEESLPDQSYTNLHGWSDAYPYPNLQPRRLVDYCNNEWQTNGRDNDDPKPLTLGHHFEICMDKFFDGCIAVIQSRRIRRHLLIFVFLSFLTLWLWMTIISPLVEENLAISVSLDKLSASAAGGLFGTNVRPSFPGIKHLETLDPDLLPRGSSARGQNPRGRRRLIFIGDIHGCKDELVTLLQAVNFNQESDHLIAAGDMVNKGPDSAGVIEILHERGASCVRGNHEDHLMLIANQLSSPIRHNDGHSPPNFDHLDEQSFSHSDEQERRLVKSLTPDQLAYLKSCPVILRVGHMKALGGDIVVVHAGLVPGLPLENQDPGSAMNMRIIDLSTHLPSKDHYQRGSIHWAKLWNKYQKLIPTQISRFPSNDEAAQALKESHTTVIYGHDSKRGLQIDKYTKGLDTGCVKGGKLTALVMTDGGKQSLMQVRCKDYRLKDQTVSKGEDRVRDEQSKHQRP